MTDKRQQKLFDRRCDVLLVDGSHLFWRSAAAATLSADGNPTGGIYAFVKALIRVHERFGGEIVVCWEGGRRETLKRVAAFDDYKKRKPQPERDAARETMSEQYVQLVELLGALGVTQAKTPGWEADDALATLAHRADKQGSMVGIYTGDSDLCQCVTENVFVIRPLPKSIEVNDVARVIERFGCSPKQIPFLKALSGDNSDGIPGVRGIGPKTAGHLVNLYKSLIGATRGAKAGEKPDIPRFGDKGWEALCESVRSGELNLWWQLARVNRTARVKIRWCEYDSKTVVAMLMKLKFRTLLGAREREQLRRLTEYAP
jgi:5'-3' exonuclease